MHDMLTLCALAIQDKPQAPQESPGGGLGPLLTTMAPLILIFAVFYFLLIRPQRKQQKERESMLGQLKKNDHVLTSGGIYGVVDRIKDNDVILKIDEKGDVRIRVVRSAIVDIQKVSGAAGSEGAPEEPEKK